MLALPALNVAAVLELPGQVKEPDIPLLRRRLCILLGRAGPRPVVCDAGRLTYPNIVAVDALARLQLTATRRGTRIAIARSSPELRELLALTGLGDVLLLCGDHRSR